MHKAAAVLGALAVTSDPAKTSEVSHTSQTSLPGAWKAHLFGPQRSACPRRTRQTPEVCPYVKNSRSCGLKGFGALGGAPGYRSPAAKRARPPSPAEAGATRSSRGRYMYFGDILPVDRPRGRYKPSAGLILSIGA